MKSFLFALLILLGAAGVRGQQTVSGGNLAEFRRISLSGRLSVVLERVDSTEACSVSVDLNGEPADRMSWSVAKGELKIKTRLGRGNGNIPQVKIRYCELDELSVSDADVRVDTLRGTKMDISLSGGKLYGAVECRDLKLEAVSGAAVELVGEADYLTLTATNTSQVELLGFVSRSLDVRAAASAVASVRATDRIVSNVQTGAKVFYAGNPPLVRGSQSLGGVFSPIAE